MGNLYVYLQEEEDNNLQKTLSWVKDKITDSQMQTLWETLANIKPATWQVMDEANFDALMTLKRQMLRDTDFCQHLDNDDLIKLGQKAQWYREVLLALIKKHLFENDLSSPFDEDFSFDLLEQGSADQNYLYVSGFIKQCKSLPVEEIVALGEKKSKIAGFILKDVGSHRDYFKLSSKFVACHPSLRKTIAHDWQAHLETFPIASHQEKFIAPQLKAFKQKYREFTSVEIGARTPKILNGNELFNSLRNAGKNNAWKYVSLARKGGKVLTLTCALAKGGPAALAPTLIAFAAFTGISMLAAKLTSKKSERKLKLS